MNRKGQVATVVGINIPIPQPAFQALLAAPKIQTHEHLDCSLRPLTMLELRYQLGLDMSMLPTNVQDFWNNAQELRSQRKGKPGRTTKRIKDAEQAAADAYQKHLVKSASESLNKYLKAIEVDILPLMQTAEALTRIMKERIEDAVSDGHIAIEIRFAPQLHLNQGLDLDQVMKAVIAGCTGSPIPVDLTLCVLRHEEQYADKMAQTIADLCVKYLEVGAIDLAGGEGVAYQNQITKEFHTGGVPDWYLGPALDAQNRRTKTSRPLEVKSHLWETNAPTPQDYSQLEKGYIFVVGHGVRGFWNCMEVCPTSNIVTGQFTSYSKHPIDRLYHHNGGDGNGVTVNTDGTTLTGLGDYGLTKEYYLLHKVFDWGWRHFYRVNVNAVKYSNFSSEVKADLMKQLDAFYLPRLNQKIGKAPAKLLV